MSKSILVIDNEDLEDVLQTLRDSELYLEVKTFEDSIKSIDTTKLLEDCMRLRIIGKNTNPLVKVIGERLWFTLGGQDESN